MRIVHTEASCGWGGQEIRILNEARGMQSRGHEVTLLCPREARIFEEAPGYGIKVVALGIGQKNLKGVFALRRWIAAQPDPIDVINSHSSTDSWLAALSLLTLGDAPALVRTRHISAPVSRGFATRWLYARATAMVVTTGESLRLALIAALKLVPVRVVSIPTGIDLARYRSPSPGERASARGQLGVTDATYVVGIVATLRSWKGHRFLIDAIAALQQTPTSLDLRVVIVGDGPQRDALSAQVDALSLGTTIHFAGNQTDVVPWLHAFDAFVLPSYANEGVPQALLQAMACAIPVVTTEAGAIGEIAIQNQTALVVAQQDAGAIADALVRLYSDRALARQLAHAGQALVVERHGIEAMLQRMEQVFEKALQTMKLNGEGRP